jgi:hypothetical protein
MKPALYTALTQHAALVALVSTRIYPEAVPPSATSPYVVYYVISNMPSQSMSATGDPWLARVQIDAVAESSATRDSVGDAVVAALNGKHHLVTTTKQLRSIRLEDQADEYEPPVSGERLGKFKRRMEFTVWYCNP